MKKHLILLLLISPLSLFAQVDPVGQFNRYVVENWAAQYQRVGQYRVKGSSFFLGEPIPGQFKYQGGNFMKNDKILYDLNTQKVGPEVDGGIFETDQIIEEFTLVFPAKYGGGTATFKNGSKYGKKAPPFVSVLVEGELVHLLSAFKIKLVADPSNMMDSQARMFEQYTEHYLYDVKNNVLTKIKLNKKDIASALKASPDLQKRVNSYQGDIVSEFSAIQIVEILNEK
jgi:hypothetical protein